MHVGAFGEGFLGDPDALAAGPDVLADLELGFHCN
jgi:hypothetical protein